MIIPLQWVTSLHIFPFDTRLAIHENVPQGYKQVLKPVAKQENLTGDHKYFFTIWCAKIQTHMRRPDDNKFDSTF